jgi:hypothetical protein
MCFSTFTFLSLINTGMFPDSGHTTSNTVRMMIRPKSLPEPLAISMESYEGK